MRDSQERTRPGVGPTSAPETPSTEPPRPGPDPLIGTTVEGRFRIVRRIAEGGMGVVYEADQLVLHRKVAMKVLHRHLAADEEIEARFRKEALAATSIGHIGIVEVFDLGKLADGRLYIVLELLDGHDLGKVLDAEGPMSLGRAARILVQVCDAVGAAHAKGIVHRDLKPENVLLVRRGELADVVKIVDFGVSKFKAPGVDSKTRTGTAVGTPYYMSPEQAQGRSDVDHRSDIYSLGVMLFRMLTGVHPFDDQSYPMLVVKICTEPPPPLARYRSGLPEAVQVLVDRLLAKIYEERPESLREVRDALARFLDDDRSPSLTFAPSMRSALPKVLESSADPHERTHYATPVRPESASPALDHTTPDAMSTAGASGTRRSPPRAPSADDTVPDVRDDDERYDEDTAIDAAAASVESSVATSNRWKVGLLAAGIVTLAGTALLAFELRPDPTVPPEEAGVALPTPMAEQSRALRASNSGEGWGFLNPRPRVMPTWHAVANGGAGLVAMVGAQGSAARFLGGYLVTYRTGLDSALDGVTWTGADELLAVGEGGVLLRLRNDGVRRLESPTNVHLHGVLSLSATEAYAVGDRGTLLRVSADRVLSMPLDTTESLFAAAERRGSVFVVGSRGTILRLDDGHVITEASGSGTLRAVGGCEASDLYAAGDDATLLRRQRDGHWRRVELDLRERPALTSIGCNHGRAVITGSGGTVLLASRDTTVRLPSNFEGTYTGVAGHPDEATWIVGTGGRLAVVSSDHLETRVSGAEASLRDIAGLAGALVGVGDWGRIVRERENDFLAENGPTSAGLGGIASATENDLIAVGDEGSLLRIRYDGATRVPLATDVGLRGVVAENGHVLAVGTHGTIVRGALITGADPAWAVSRIDFEDDLQAVAGVPTDAMVVGNGGAVFHLGQRSTRRIRCDTDVPLYGVTRDRDGTYVAVGGGGVVVRIGERECTVEHRDGPDLRGVGLGPDGALLAVGDRGAAIVRGADGAWSPVDLDVGRTALRAVRRIGDAVYVVGASGVILRHVVHDGT